jgi:RNA polymerase sigma-70 factor (ECF subfamily)
MKESQCITAFQIGDHKAFTFIFNLFHKRLVFFAGNMLSSKDAEDVVQEAFIKLWERKENFDALQRIKAFLYLSVKNTCLNNIKHHKVVYKYEKSVCPVQDNNTALHKMIEVELMDEVHNALHSLPLGCRNVIHYRYFEGLSNQEVAGKLYVSINTVKTQKGRGLQILRNTLHKKFTHEEKMIPLCRAS